MADWTDPPYSALVAGKAWTDAKASAAFENTVALGEAAPTVPLDLLPTVLLGTIATTSGLTQTLSSLDLTPFRRLIAVVDGVSSSNSTTQTLGLTIAGCGVWDDLVTSINALRGCVSFELTGGIGTSMVASLTTSAPSNANAQTRILRSSLSQATTSISAVMTRSGGTSEFNAGAVRVYGVK